jgi:NADH-quinone oxidoreductase subunit H
MEGFLATPVGHLALTVAQAMALLVPLLIGVAYLTYAERKVLAAMQLRKGPNVVGPFGLLQPFADAIKMLMKETIIPSGASRVLFIMAPMITFMLAMLAWAVIPVNDGWAIADINVGSCTCSRSLSWRLRRHHRGLGVELEVRLPRRAALGGADGELRGLDGLRHRHRADVRGLAEPDRDRAGAGDLWFIIPLFPMFVIMFISALAETNRAPFDLPEGESELVAGFFVEYSSMSFALFFLGEYANMILMSALITILFLGGWLPPLDIAPFNWIPGRSGSC